MPSAPEVRKHLAEPARRCTPERDLTDHARIERGAITKHQPVAKMPEIRARSSEPDSSSPAMTELVMRDRLLLAFADLRSFGIVAEPAVSGSITEATAFMQTEAARRAPFAQRDYVFWLEADDAAAFDAA
jgi:hypothetical protein